MELWRAGHLAEYLRSDASKGEKYDTIRDFIHEHEDWMEAFVLLYHERPSVSVGWFTSRAPRQFGIHVEEWLELTDKEPIVPLIASESDNVDSGWSIDDTFTVLSRIETKTLDDIVSTLSQSEAYLFWQVALGDNPCFSKRNMLRAIAHASDYTIDELKRTVAFTPFLEVVERAIRGDLPKNSLMVAGNPLKPPALYSVWNKIGLPFKTTIVEVLQSPRHFLHYTGTDAIIYTRDGDLVQSWESTHPPSIFEIECSDDYDPSTVMYTDVLLHDGEHKWKQKYSSRKAFLSEHYKQRASGSGRKIDTVAEFRMVLTEAQPHQTIRLIDDVAYYDDDFKGGYILHQQSFKLPLLITHIRETPIGIRVKLGALDGYSVVYVGEMSCGDDVEHNIRTNLGQHLRSKWVRIDDVGCVVWVSANDILSNDGHYHLQSPKILGIESKMGFGDTIQLSDIFSIMMREY